jgi:hypothetical protein
MARVLLLIYCDECPRATTRTGLVYCEALRREIPGGEIPGDCPLPKEEEHGKPS